MKVFLYCVFCVIAFVPATNLRNLGLVSGEVRRTKNPLNIKKTSHRSPITLHIKKGITNLRQIPSPLLSRGLSSKQSPLKPKLLKIPKLSKLPMLPKLPLIPLLPILPPIIPKLPLLPLPLLPIIPPIPLFPLILPKVSKLLKPLRVPIISKGRLQKALGSELKPVSIPVENLIQRKNIKRKRNKGTLPASQFIRSFIRN